MGAQDILQGSHLEGMVLRKVPKGLDMSRLNCILGAQDILQGFALGGHGIEEGTQLPWPGMFSFCFDTVDT